MPASDVSSLRSQVEEAADALRPTLARAPVVAVIAERGLPALSGALEEAEQHTFDEDERLHAGMLAGTPTALVQARSLDDGFTAQEVALPVRVLAALGAEAFVLLGRAAGLAPSLRPGETMLVTDHLNLQGVNSLAGPNEDAWGPRFPDMSAPYDADWCAATQRKAETVLHRGVYAAVPGPAPATPAEEAMLRRLGADAMGTGLVPEVLAARHMDCRVLAAVHLAAPGEEAPEADAAALLRVAVREMVASS